MPGDLGRRPQVEDARDAQVPEARHTLRLQRAEIFGAIEDAGPDGGAAARPHPADVTEVEGSGDRDLASCRVRLSHSISRVAGGWLSTGQRRGSSGGTFNFRDVGGMR